jgi:hypothetical protein
MKRPTEEIETAKRQRIDHWRVAPLCILFIAKLFMNKLRKDYRKALTSYPRSFNVIEQSLWKCGLACKLHISQTLMSVNQSVPSQIFLLSSCPVAMAALHILFK